MSYRGRFAPSPSGPLHFGSLVAAVASWLDARAAGGEWLVRMEDVDTTRTVTGAADEILRALDACGLHWDGEVVRQSERTLLYAEALERLRARASSTAAAARASELADSGCRHRGRVYPALPQPRLAPRRGADRVRVGSTRSRSSIACRAESAALDADIGDFVLRRRDGLYAYQLAVVVDDAAQASPTSCAGRPAALDAAADPPAAPARLPDAALPARARRHASRRQKLSKQNLAPALDPAPVRRCRRARLPRPAVTDAGSPGDCSRPHAGVGSRANSGSPRGRGPAIRA
jgi:glutamyl-Q tRNA(Asp) synthetase